MRLLTSGAVLLICLAGCSDSNSNALTAAEVTRALKSEGLSVGVARGGEKEKFHKVFAQDIGEVEDVVGSISPSASRRPTGRVGVGVGDLVIAGLIYKHQADASCSRSNVIGVCLHKRNVVIVVRSDRAQAARRALKNLG